HGKLAFRCFLDAAGDRRIDIHQAPAFEAAAKVSRECGRDGGTRDDDRTGIHALRQTAGAEDHLFGLLRIDNEDYDGAGAATCFTRATGSNAAELLELPARFRANIVAGYKKARAQQRSGYTHAHRTEADHAYRQPGLTALRLHSS